MIKRLLHSILSMQLNAKPDTPVLMTGAAGNGKTSLATALSDEFEQYVSFDMENPSDRRVIEACREPEDILRTMVFSRGFGLVPRKALLFLREIGQCRAALNWFSSNPKLLPGISVIASTSHLSKEIREAMLLPSISSIFVPPLTFHEFLQATAGPDDIAAFGEVPVPLYAYERLLHLFHTYSLTGGMPAIVDRFISAPELSALSTVFEEILDRQSALLLKNSPTEKKAMQVIETYNNIFPYAATRITFRHLGNSPLGSREISAQLKILEENMLVTLVYPMTSSDPDDQPDHTRSPRLHLTDTGMVNYFSGIQGALNLSGDMNAIFQGQVARHVAGQEILAHETDHLLHFWVRNKNQSSAEVDYVLPFKNMLIPVVVRSGEPGRLRALHQFIDSAGHPYAVRLSAARLSVTQARTLGGKHFFLLNLPYFLAGRIREHLPGFIRLSGGDA